MSIQAAFTPSQEDQRLDKSEWPPGPWIDEPDHAQWTDESTGLPCMVHRHGMGHLCGYVGVPQGSPLYGMGYYVFRWSDDEPELTAPQEAVNGLRVHGGLIYSAKCDGSELCHVSEPEEEVWWFGFDCAHRGDRSPAREAPYLFNGPGDTYRDYRYVRRQCGDLAEQIHAIHRLAEEVQT